MTFMCRHFGSSMLTSTLRAGTISVEAQLLAHFAGTGNIALACRCWHVLSWWIWALRQTAHSAGRWPPSAWTLRSGAAAAVIRSWTMLSRCACKACLPSSIVLSKDTPPLPQAGCLWPSNQAISVPSNWHTLSQQAAAYHSGSAC